MILLKLNSRNNVIKIISGGFGRSRILHNKLVQISSFFKYNTIESKQSFSEEHSFLVLARCGDPN